jgi:hypothetical protein
LPSLHNKTYPNPYHGYSPIFTYITIPPSKLHIFPSATPPPSKLRIFPSATSLLILQLILCIFSWYYLLVYTYLVISHKTISRICTVEASYISTNYISYMYCRSNPPPLLSPTRKNRFNSQLFTGGHYLAILLSCFIPTPTMGPHTFTHHTLFSSYGPFYLP